ncbi:MAG: HEAT repeat domain-containing protein [Candidatus Tectimicrobiota bacterium]
MRFPWGVTARRVRPKALVQIPFVGRDVLLTTLADHLHMAQSGSLQLVAVEGEAGSGKTALLEEFTFLHCRTPSVLLLQLNAATCLLPHEVYRQLCQALQQRSEHIVQSVYSATKRLRKALALQWDEDEFQQILAAEWGQGPAMPLPARGLAGRSAPPLAQLLESVREHPWAMGAAALLGQRERRVLTPPSSQFWEQRWLLSLKALASRTSAVPAALVILLDQCTAPRLTTEPQQTSEHPDWRTFATLLASIQLPTFVVWAGTAMSLAPVQQALCEEAAYAPYRLEPLPPEEQQRFVHSLARTLPRSRQAVWQQALMGSGEAPRVPGHGLLATTAAAALSTGSAELSRLAQADMTLLVRQLVDHLATVPAITPALVRQVLSFCAFLPANAPLVVDDLLPWCDFAALGLDIAAGRAQLETFLSHCVRYGLVHYDPYATRYTLGHSALQEALQAVTCPDPATRRQMVAQWALATAMLRHVRQGEREGLAEMAAMGLAVYGAALRELLAPTVLAAFRRLVPMSTKDERQRMAYALGGFPTELAVDMLRLLLQDDDGQVRSGAVQSLADLAMAATLPGLLEALQDRNSDVRWIAAQALGQMPEARAVDALIPMLTDDDKEVGRIAAQGLGQQGDSRAVPHLIAATRDDYPLLRESAIVALGHLADRRAIPALQAVLQDPHQQVRRSAAMALARFATSAGG